LQEAKREDYLSTQEEAEAAQALIDLVQAAPDANKFAIDAIRTFGVLRRPFGGNRPGEANIAVYLAKQAQDSTPPKAGKELEHDIRRFEAGIALANLAPALYTVPGWSYETQAWLVGSVYADFVEWGERRRAAAVQAVSPETLQYYAARFQGAVEGLREESNDSVPVVDLATAMKPSAQELLAKKEAESKDIRDWLGQAKPMKLTFTPQSVDVAPPAPPASK
jgi:hypothetical protein